MRIAIRHAGSTDFVKPLSPRHYALKEFAFRDANPVDRPERLMRLKCLASSKLIAIRSR
jgi:hypothetical protein